MLVLGAAAVLFTRLAGSGGTAPQGDSVARPSELGRGAEVARPGGGSIDAPAEPERTDLDAAPAEAAPERRVAGTPKGLPALGALKQTLVGLVVGDGKPISGAQVLYTDRAGEALCEATSDPRGNFELAVPRPLEDGLILVQARGFAPLETGPHAIRAGERRFVGNLQVARGIMLRGKVVAPGGFALAEARVQLRAGGPGGGFNRYVQEAVADADGGFEFPQAPLGTVKVEAFANGYGARSEELRHASAKDHALIELVPERAMLLLLRDPDGAGVAGARVNLRPHDPRSTDVSATADDNGDCHVLGLGSELWEVRAEADGYRPAVRDRMRADGNPIEVELLPWPCIEGRISAPAGAALPSGVTVRPLSANARGGFVDSGRHDETPVAADGSFRICDMRPGLYVIRASAPGFAPTSSETIRLTLGKDAVGVDVELRSGGGLNLLVHSGDGPVGGARVELFDTTPPPTELYRSPATPQPVSTVKPVANATTSSEGEVAFEHLAEGRYWCIVRPRDLLPQLYGPIVVQEGRKEKVGPVQVSAGGRLHGTVTDGAGKPVANAVVHVFGESGSVRTPIQIEANDKGAWTSPLLPGGSYRLTARIVYGRPATARTATARGSVEVGARREVALQFE
ncbi:MAG: carboxypeptidase regulatory-like domain-containing protein [Planctomycetota bacterium]